MRLPTVTTSAITDELKKNRGKSSWLEEPLVVVGRRCLRKEGSAELIEEVDLGA